jgi:hypothetical protein
MNKITALVTSLLFVSTTNGFLSPVVTRSRLVTTVVSISDSDDIPSIQEETEIEEYCSLPTQRGKVMSESIPFLKCPLVLLDSDLAGNVGFDPLRLANNQEKLMDYREAEIKHARLAMLAAIGWPVSELKDRDLAQYFNAPSVLDDGDRVPSILNGGLERIDPRFWGFCLGLTAAIDMYGVSKSRRGAANYFPGNLEFDPLKLFPPDREGQEKMKLAEIKHGRIAMLGVIGYVIEEFVTKIAVVDDTPILFQPLTETVEEVFEEVEGILEEVISSTFFAFV